MKTILISILLISGSAFAGINYQCVSDKMQAINSDIYYNLSPNEIDLMAQNTEALGHTEMIKAINSCAVCDGNFEAQFIANYSDIKISKAKNGMGEETSFMLKGFRFYQVNQLCPLDIAQAETAIISVMGALQVHEGAEVSGVLVYKSQTNKYVIE